LRGSLSSIFYPFSDPSQFPAHFQQPFYPSRTIAFGIDAEHWLSSGESDEQPGGISQGKVEAIGGVYLGHLDPLNGLGQVIADTPGYRLALVLGESEIPALVVVGTYFDVEIV